MLGDNAIATTPLDMSTADPAPPPVTDVFFEYMLCDIERGMKASTAAQMGGILVE